MQIISITANKGDLLEDISFKYLGHSDLDSVFKLNPHLLNKVYLQNNDIVFIPVDAPKSTGRKINLW